MRRARPSPFARTFAALAVILLATLIAGAVLEWMAGVGLRAIRDKRPHYMLQYTDDNIRRLYDTDQPDRVRAIIEESGHQADPAYSAFVEYRMVPVQGKYVNVSDEGWRANGAEPERSLSRPGRKVFVFGGSTTFGVGVADNETIPAYLEAALRTAGVADAQVFNFGQASWYSTQERIALERMVTAGIVPDLAVFVDGLNEFYHCAVPDVSAWNDRLVQTTRARARMPLTTELAHRSNIVALARHLGGDKSVSVREGGSFCESDADVEKVVRRLDANRRILDGMADRLGFKVAFVQQPVPTYAYDNRKRLFPVNDEILGHYANSARGYPRLVEMKAKGGLFDRNLIWLPEFEPEGNAYIDTVHYSPGFNKAIAERIAAHVTESGLLP